MLNSDHIQVGVRVLILRPSYVAGKYGVVCGQESKLDSQAKQRWLIQVENADSSSPVHSYFVRYDYEIRLDFI